ncbi:MAG: hypothetical protein SchgKO_07750 [Schleiferiaceae bacterium]
MVRKYLIDMKKQIFRFLHKRGLNLAASIVLCSAIGGGLAGVGIQTMGAWPSWLGGSYVSAEGCDCQDYAEGLYYYHWVACPVKNLWGLNNTGSWSAPEIHEGTCDSCGH